VLPDALAPSSDRLSQSFECDAKDLLRPFLFADYVCIVSFRSAEKPNHSITLDQGNDADDLVLGKDNQ
jgi:hypothetical protein